MRSTKTATREPALHWERVGGAHAGIVAEYGPWRFHVYAWQRGSYLATAQNAETGEYRAIGNAVCEIPSQAAGRAWCEKHHLALCAADLAHGITRG